MGIKLLRPEVVRCARFFALEDKVFAYWEGIEGHFVDEMLIAEFKTEEDAHRFIAVVNALLVETKD